jgi:hypothetical protein
MPFFNLTTILIGDRKSSMDANAPNITDWIQAISEGVAACVAIILLIGLYLTAKQIKEATKWNKLNAAFTYYNSDIFLRRERAMVDVLVTMELDFYEMKIPLDETNTDVIWSSLPKFREVRDYLDVLEFYAIAVNAGVLDDDCAYALGYGYVTRAVCVFQPIIEKMRQSTNHDDYYIEIEKLESKWSKRAKIEKAAKANALIQAEEQLQETKGVRPKV